MAGLLSLFQNPKATNPFQKAPTAPNFQTIAGQNVAAPTYQAGQPLGVRAANPIDNKTVPKTTIAPKYQSTNQLTALSPTQSPYGGLNPTAGGTQNAPGVNGANPNLALGAMAKTPEQIASTTGQIPTAQNPQATPTAAPGILNTLLGTTQGNQQIGQNAAGIAANYGKQIADVGQQAAMAQGSVGKTTPVVFGSNAIIQQNAAARQTALAQGESAALQGTQQQLSAQGQQQSGQEAALNSATNLSQIPYGTPVYNAATGQYVNSVTGQAMDPNVQAQQLAQKVLSNQMTYADAVNSLGYAGQAGQTFLNNAIHSVNPNFNIAQATGSYNAQQQNTTTASTAPTNAYAAAYQQNYPAQLQLQGQLQNVEGLGNLLLTTAQGGQINPFDLSFANQTLGQFRSGLSVNQQAQFNQSLATYAGAVSQLLAGSSDVTPTQISTWTNGITDGTLKMSALKAAYDQALKEGNIKLQTAQSLTNIPGSAIGAPQTGGNTNPLGI